LLSVFDRRVIVQLDFEWFIFSNLDSVLPNEQPIIIHYIRSWQAMLAKNKSDNNRKKKLSLRETLEYNKVEVIKKVSKIDFKCCIICIKPYSEREGRRIKMMKVLIHLLEWFPI
jgi:hypothetical protein